MKSRLFNIALKRSLFPIIFGALFLFGGITLLTTGDISLGSIFVAIFGIGFLVAFGLPLINGGYLKDFNAVLSGNGLTMEQVEADLAGAQKFKNIEFGRNYALVLNESPKLVVLQNLVWCYGVNTTTTHKLYGIIPTGKTKSYAVKLINRDRSEISVPVAKETDSAPVLQAIQARIPAVILGYNENIDNLAKANFAELVRYVDQRKQQG